MSDDLTPLFANPARYELWDCKQLESERKDIARQTLEIEGLIAKAQTGVAGPLVAEMAYRNDYLALRGQAHFAEEAWRKNKCRETQPVAPAEESVSPAKSAPVSKAGKTIY
jgi:hypothetical protein